MPGLDLLNSVPENTMALDERPRVYDQHNLEGRDAPASAAFDEGATGLAQLTNGLQALLQVTLSLGTKLDALAATQQRQLRLWEQMQRGTPVDYAVVASGTYPTSGILVLNFGSPDQGTQWEVTGCCVGGTDVNVGVAGSAGLYVSAMVPVTGSAASASPGGAGMGNLVDRTATLPNATTYGTHQLVVNDDEDLFLIIYGGTSGTTYVANMSATTYNPASTRGRDITVL